VAESTGKDGKRRAPPSWLRVFGPDADLADVVTVSRSPESDVSVHTSLGWWLFAVGMGSPR
jgi:hypothetical protein